MKRPSELPELKAVLRRSEPRDLSAAEKTTALALTGDAEEMALQVPTQLVGDKNPYLVYVGGLDKASQPTMGYTAKKVAILLSSGKIEDPSRFPWHTLSYGVVKRLRSLLAEHGYAPRSANKALTLIRNVLRDAWLLEMISHEDYQKICAVKNLSTDGQLPTGRVVERIEVAYLLLPRYGIQELTDGEVVCDARDAALIALLAGAGLREKEAVNLKRGDYNPATGVIRILKGKHHKQREAFLAAAYDIVLKRFLKIFPGEVADPLIPRLSPEGKIVEPLRGITTQTVHLVLEKRAIQSGIVEPFTPHDLRRSFITHQLEEGVDVLRLARAVGHASPKTTMIYDRRTRESDRVAIRGETAMSEKERLNKLENEKKLLSEATSVSDESISKIASIFNVPSRELVSRFEQGQQKWTEELKRRAEAIAQRRTKKETT